MGNRQTLVEMLISPQPTTAIDKDAGTNEVEQPSRMTINEDAANKKIIRRRLITILSVVLVSLLWKHSHLSETIADQGRQRFGEDSVRIGHIELDSCPESLMCGDSSMIKIV
jgi:hypothetical protein